MPIFGVRSLYRRSSKGLHIIGIRAPETPMEKQRVAPVADKWPAQETFRIVSMRELVLE